MADIPPNHTVYINNLNDRLKKEELKRQLYTLFAQFGVILEVTSPMKMRGQAFVTFREISSATQALRSLQGFSFFDKPMRLAYGKAKANVVREMEGTFDRWREAKRAKSGKGAAAAVDPEAHGQPEEGPGPDASEVPTAAPAAGEGSRAREQVASNEQEPPNKVLFLRNLPSLVTDKMLRTLFEQFPGFSEVRLVPGDTELAFVEYGSDVQAGKAMDALQGFKITPSHQLLISFAKQ